MSCLTNVESSYPSLLLESATGVRSKIFPVGKGEVKLDLSWLRRPRLAWKQSLLILAIALAHTGASALLAKRILPFLTSKRRLLSKEHLNVLVTMVAVIGVSGFQFTSPGFVKKQPRRGPKMWRLPLDVNVAGVSMSRTWCSECDVYRPLRCSHCPDCDRCVLMSDHHCMYLGNCVGQQNYRSYMVTLLALLMPALYSVPTCALAIRSSWRGSPLASLRNQWAAYLLLLVHIGGAAGPLDLLGWHMSFICQNITSREWYKRQTRACQEANPFDEGSCLANFFAFMRVSRDGTN